MRKQSKPERQSRSPTDKTLPYSDFEAENSSHGLPASSGETTPTTAAAEATTSSRRTAATTEATAAATASTATETTATTTSGSTSAAAKAATGTTTTASCRATTAGTLDLGGTWGRLRLRQELLQWQELLGSDVELVALFEGSGLDALGGLNGEVNLVNGSEDFVDLANGSLQKKLVEFFSLPLAYSDRGINRREIGRTLFSRKI